MRINSLNQWEILLQSEGDRPLIANQQWREKNPQIAAKTVVKPSNCRGVGTLSLNFNYLNAPKYLFDRNEAAGTWQSEHPLVIAAMVCFVGIDH